MPPLLNQPQKDAQGLKPKEGLMARLSRYLFPLQPNGMGTGIDAERGGTSGTSRGTRASLAVDPTETDLQTDAFENAAVRYVALENDLYAPGVASYEKHPSARSSVHSLGQSIDSPPCPRQTLSRTFTLERFPRLQACYRFFNPRFEDAKIEKAFQNEAWWEVRKSALPCSSFYIISWVLSLALSARPIPEFNKYAFIIFNAIVATPLPLLVLGDFIRKCPFFYQLIVWLATWEFAFAVIINMHMCRFFNGGFCINAKAFIAIYFWSACLPTVALLGLGQTRGWNALGVAVYVGLMIGLIYVDNAPKLSYRNLILFLMYHCFLTMIALLREKTDRRVFMLHVQLTEQICETQAARVAEQKEAESKRRFISYIFHEVRVPLNIALLSVQNLESENVYQSCTAGQKDIASGLSNSLASMETVLNDVLSFDKMTEGRFSLASKAFDLNKAMENIVVAHRSISTARGLTLTQDFDPAIDALGQFIGDDLRICQVVQNLISNSNKFTEAGGVHVTTRLFCSPQTSRTTPRETPPMSEVEKSPCSGISTVPRLSRNLTIDTVRSEASEKFNMHVKPDSSYLSTPIELKASRPTSANHSSPVIVRVEVQDSGPGLKACDVADNRLFSPYVQSELGRRQGGKGSGLGLALCLQIIKLLKGRFGVDSVFGKGSVFWFEIVRAFAKLSSVPICLQPLVLAPPLKRPTTPAPATPTAPGTPTAFGTPKSHKRHESLKNSLQIRRSSVEPVSDEQLQKLRILVVDDDAITRKLMIRILERQGHSIENAENGLAALNLLQSQQFDLVFLDNQMPILSGVEVCRKVRNMGSLVTIVGCTGNALEDDQREYLAAGVNQILLKPIKQSDMLEIIENVRNGKLGGHVT